MNLQQGDVVELRVHGEALWRVEEVGEVDYYENGQFLSEESSRLVLFLPAPGRARCAYPRNEYAMRQDMLHVAAMEVIARTVTAPSDVEQRRIDSKWKRRLKRWVQLRMQAQTFKKARERNSAKKRLKEFEKKNYDLVRLYR